MSVFARNAALIRQKKEIIKMITAGKNNKTTSNRVALYGLLIALAFVLSYIETLFPVYMGAPGVKLGLANLVTVIALYGLGVKEACHQSGAGDLSRFYFWEYGIHSIWISRGVFKSAFNGHMQIFSPF